MRAASINPHTDAFICSPVFADPEMSPDRIENAISIAQQSALKRQNTAGYWAGELRADASVPAGYIPFASC